MNDTTPPEPATDQRVRKRAGAMDPRRRRDMIVRSALPLVAVHGAAVTTRQIARAAGIGEGTVFRVFATKEELLAACVDHACRPDDLLANLAAIALDEPLADRLAEALAMLRSHLERMGTVIGALHATGLAAPGDPAERAPRGSREESLARMRAAVAGLFAPEADRLRVSPDIAAAMLLGLSFTRPQLDEEVEDTDHSIVDVVLHGALTG